MNSPVAQQASVTALDIVVEPDATMQEHASAVNARLLGDYPQGFRLEPIVIASYPTPRPLIG